MTTQQFIIVCQKYVSPDDLDPFDEGCEGFHDGESDCPECFIEKLCQHVEFRNGEMVLKKVRIE